MRRRYWLIVIWLIAYIGSYMILSVNGRYAPLIAGASNGSEHWYPLWCDNRTPGPPGRIKTEHPSLLGLVYLPLRINDWKYCHPSKPGITFDRERLSSLQFLRRKYLSR